jgi:hypothetical protein
LNFTRRLFNLGLLSLAAFFTPHTDTSFADGTRKMKPSSKSSDLVLETRWAASKIGEKFGFVAIYTVRVKGSNWPKSLESDFESDQNLIWRIDEELTKRLEREHIKEIDDANDRVLVAPKTQTQFEVPLSLDDVNSHVAVPK